MKGYTMETKTIEEILISGLTLLALDRNTNILGRSFTNKDEFTDDEVREVRRAVRAHFSRVKATQ